MRAVVVVPDGPRLAGLGELLSAGPIDIRLHEAYGLEDAQRALNRVLTGTGGRAVVLQP